MPKHPDLTFDYDSDPERFRANMRATSHDIHAAVAGRFAAARLDPVLDLGCGEGRFTLPARQLGLTTVAFDLSATMLAALDALDKLDSLLVQGDAARLPFAPASFGGAAALYMLYHLADPRQGLAECQRVLRPDGWFAASAPSRFNDPELADFLPSGLPETFDAENGPGQVAEYFQIMSIERWDAPLMKLADPRALALYLRGRGLSPVEIEAALPRIQTPLTLTKRGMLVYGIR